MARSNGWQSGETTNNPRHLVRGAVSVRSNVHRNGTDLEILIHDLDASRGERWTSITFDRSSGEIGVGRASNAAEAWRLANQELTKAA
jgi:hypothetical protein